MKRLRSSHLAFLILAVVIVLGLFFGDFLTGADHLELQHPYSRAVQVKDYRFGLHFEHEESNAMSDYYYKVLKQPRDDKETVLLPCDASYHVKQFSGRIVREKGPFAPITELDPATEYEFVITLPDNKTRVAVIHSLYRKRGSEENAAGVKHNQMLAAEEHMRADTIRSWHGFESKDATKSQQQWWRENASVFGITPEGDPLPAAPSAPATP